MGMVKNVAGKIDKVQESEEELVVCKKCKNKYPKFWKKCPYCSKEKNKNIKIS